MTREGNKGTREEELHSVPWALFLEEYPPGNLYPVKDVIEADGPFFNIATPDIRLYCNHQSCHGQQTFTYSGVKLSVSIGKKADYIMNYTCHACNRLQKTLKVHLHISSLFGINKAMKY